MSEQKQELMETQQQIKELAARAFEIDHQLSSLVIPKEHYEEKAPKERRRKGDHADAVARRAAGGTHGFAREAVDLAV